MAARKIILTDGGMGQELVHRGAVQTSPMWGAQVMIDKPDMVCELHKDYIGAGAKVITLNTYSVTPERLAYVDAEDQFESLQLLATELAVRARDESAIAGVKIAASLPPLYSSYQPELSPSYEKALATYRKVVKVQRDHVDLFLCETMSGIGEAVASATAASEAGIPFWVAFSVDDTGNGLLRSGETIRDAYNSIEKLKPQAVMINCSIPEAVDAAWGHMQQLGCPAGAYANGFTSVLNLEAGGGVEMLEARTDLDPAAYAKYAMNWVEQGAAIVGGCCEISPQHIQVLAQHLDNAGYEVVGDFE